MTRPLNYSKWDHIEVSDDEDDTHPNIDTPSLFRWRHQARVEKMESLKQEKGSLESETVQHKRKVQELTEKIKSSNVNSDAENAKRLQVQLEELKKQEEEFRKKEAELSKKERLTPWNVDTLSSDGFEKTIINKPAQKEVISEEEKHQRMLKYIDENERSIKKFGMLKDYDESASFLRDNPDLVCVDTANYLTMWCVNLEVQEKHSLMVRVSHQTIVMQYILELAKQLERDPRSCVQGFFQRIKSAEKQYVDAFEDELKGFISRVEGRAKARIEEAVAKAEEEEKQKRLGPGGVDPLEVMETLPAKLKECFETRNVSMLQDAISEMTKEEAAYHMKRCVDSGLWVADAKTAGLTPASEELKNMASEVDEGTDVTKGEGSDSDEFYENADDDDGKADDDDGKAEDDLDLD